MNKTQEEFVNHIGDCIVFLTNCPQKGEEGYGSYIRECMIMEESIEVGSTISVNINDKSYIGKVLNLWEGGFNILLNGTKEWKDRRNTKSFAYHSVDEITKLN